MVFFLDVKLLSVFNSINKSLDLGNQTDVVYLEFSKAFDPVANKLLIHKLKSFGIACRLLSWFSYYLSKRKQRVVIDGSPSNWLPVPSRVPQGSILGQFLFLLFTNLPR